MPKTKTKEEKLREKIDNMLKDIRTSRATAWSIAKNSAVKIANNLDREDEKGKKERNQYFVDYKIWQARSETYEEAERIILKELRGY